MVFFTCIPSSFFIFCSISPVVVKFILLEQKNVYLQPFANASAEFSPNVLEPAQLPLYFIYLSIREFGSWSCTQIRTVCTSLFPIVKHDLDHFVVILRRERLSHDRIVFAFCARNNRALRFVRGKRAAK